MSYSSKGLIKHQTESEAAISRSESSTKRKGSCWGRTERQQVKQLGCRKRVMSSGRAGEWGRYNRSWSRRKEQRCAYSTFTFIGTSQFRAICPGQRKKGSFSNELKQTANLCDCVAGTAPALQAGETEFEPRNWHKSHQIWWCLHVVPVLPSRSRVSPWSSLRSLVIYFLSSKSLRETLSSINKSYDSWGMTSVQGWPLASTHTHARTCLYEPATHMCTCNTCTLMHICAH